MKHDKNPDVDVLYYADKALCCIPKGLESASFFTSVVSEERNAAGYETSWGGKHRSWNGIGMILLTHKIITPKQYVEHFISRNQKREFMRIVNDISEKIRTEADLVYKTKKLSNNPKYK